MPWDAVTHDGQWAEVPDDVAHVVLKIRETWPELEVQYCENPELGDAPFKIVENLRDGRRMDVMTVWELDNRLLEVLHQADMSKHDVMKIMDRANDKARINNYREILYWKDYLRDVLSTAANHSGSSFTFKDPRPDHEGELVKVEDDPAHRTKIV